MRTRHRRLPAPLFVVGLIALPVLFLPSCGGGGGGPGPDGAGQGLILVSFSLAGVDTVPINPVLEFRFSEAVDPGTVTDGSIQIREGEAFGFTVAGAFTAQDDKVLFWPRLPGLCDLSDAGFKPSTRYSVTVVGYPEQFAVRNTQGQFLDRTTTYEFTTLPESDPDFFVDQIPGRAPEVTNSDPADESAAVWVGDGNEVSITFSENLDPCSIDESTVLFQMCEVGDPDTFEDAGGGRFSGFVPVADNDPDPYKWGSTVPFTTRTPPQRIPARIALTQSFDETQVVITPLFGRFPENALIVVALTFGIRDFGGDSLSPTTISFTTENQVAQRGTYVLDYDGKTPIDQLLTTADVNTERSPDRAQGWFVFAGDGDNGSQIIYPAAPLPCYGQVNDGVLDHFDPQADIVLDTGATVNTCQNAVDGSYAVVWEFESFRIRSGRTVRIVGTNAALFLVRGDVQIDAGGTLQVRGAPLGGAPPVADGEDWKWIAQGASVPVTSHGGRGVAGGCDGGASIYGLTNYGQDGIDGVGSPDERLQGGWGSGKGGVAISKTERTNGGSAGGGGGGGHASNGTDGASLTSPYATFKDVPRSDGGSSYYAGTDASRMLLPSAGSGGGGGGWLDPIWAGGSRNAVSGGGGGAGGGFVDISCGGDITIFGTIDVSGGSGGRGVGLWNGSYLARSGGGGGGSGGGIRLLTPNQLAMSATTVLNAVGGDAGLTSTTSPPPFNFGGAGSTGRIVLEDGDSVIPGLANALLSPGEGTKGFYRGIFDPLRFVEVPNGVAVTEPFFLGPFALVLIEPVQGDFIAGAPAASAPGVGVTIMLLEACGFPVLSDGSPDLSASTGWYTIGFFSDTGQPTAPRWTAGSQPPDFTPPPDNVGAGIGNLNLPVGGSPYIQVRVTFRMAAGVGPAAPGPFLDRWSIFFDYNQ